jgi:hypothetical protein
VLLYSLAVGQDVSGPALRLAATVFDIALAFGGMALLTMEARRSHAATRPT